MFQLRWKEGNLGGEGKWASAALGAQKHGGDEGERGGRRDGVGDGSKRSSLLTSFSWEAESEGKGRCSYCERRAGVY